jgi:hypothetical protein
MIPQFSTILSATLTLAASTSRSGTVVNATIKGHDAGHAPQFSTYADFMNRPRTGNSVAWNAIASWTAGNDYTSADISAIIQEIVNHAGWDAGNAIVLFIENNGSTAGAFREFASFDHPTVNAALLSVMWK